MKKRTASPADPDQFARKTLKEITVWDWAIRILPTAALACIAISYYFGWNTGLDLFLDLSIVIFLICSLVWWYWALMRIAGIALHIKRTQEKFRSLIGEIKQFKKELNENAGVRQRRKQIGSQEDTKE